MRTVSSTEYELRNQFRACPLTFRDSACPSTGGGAAESFVDLPIELCLVQQWNKRVMAGIPDNR